MLISEAGLANKNKELEGLRSELAELGRRKGQEAIHSGNVWHDNPDFEQSEIEERRLTERIRSLEGEIHKSEIIKRDVSEGTVSINSIVLLYMKFGEEEEAEEIEIILSDISIPKEGYATINSPLGKALYGKKAGAKGNYYTNGIKVSFTIKAILGEI